MIKLYIFKVTSIDLTKRVRLSPAREEELDKDLDAAITLNIKQSFGADNVLYHIFHDLTNKSFDDFIYYYDENGAPYFKDLPYNISISHSNEYSIGVVSDHKIGVDLEYIHDVNFEHLVDRYFHNDEKNLCKTNESFLDIWTKKEAYFKYNKFNCRVLLNSFSVANILDNFIKIDNLEGYIINILREIKEDVEIINIDENDYVIKEFTIDDEDF